MTIRPALAHDAAALAAIHNQGIEHACLDDRWLEVVIVERLIEENPTGRRGATAGTDRPIP
jgi:L-amino acid N-acyltransferase YncA